MLLLQPQLCQMCRAEILGCARLDELEQRSGRLYHGADDEIVDRQTVRGKLGDTLRTIYLDD